MSALLILICSISPSLSTCLPIFTEPVCTCSATFKPPPTNTSLPTVREPSVRMSPVAPSMIVFASASSLPPTPMVPTVARLPVAASIVKVRPIPAPPCAKIRVLVSPFSPAGTVCTFRLAPFLPLISKPLLLTSILVSPSLKSMNFVFSCNSPIACAFLSTSVLKPASIPSARDFSVAIALLNSVLSAAFR